jgi:hypothetical protein
MHDKIIPHQALPTFTITITTSKNINASILRTILKKKK